MTKGHKRETKGLRFIFLHFFLAFINVVIYFKIVLKGISGG